MIKNKEFPKIEPINNMSEDLLYKIAITKVPKVGPVLSKNLISYCGGAEAVFKASKRELVKVPGIGPTLANSIIKGAGLEAAEKEFKFLQKNKIQALFYLEDDYPQRLKHYHDCPILLYFKGNADLNHKKIVAIVGTRKPTIQGKVQCEDLVEGLMKFDALVISGLAYGIDITAHKKCVDLGMPTVGVMGHGLSTIYPSSHQRIADRMVENGGLLTEFTNQTTPEREFFPMRNRIIAGMCDALIVVETARKGGSMISAHMANDYGKDVFAVPGRLKDEMSTGCNHLIKTHKAALLESVEDLAYVLRWEAGNQVQNIQTSLFVDLNPEEQKIVDLLKEQEDLGIDKLCSETKIAAGRLASLLLDLEFKGLLRAKPGKRFMLT